jgi:hypothetical protein
MFEQPREIAAYGTNAYEFDFEKNWLAVKNEFDVEQDARMEKFEIRYGENGEINQLRYDFVEHEQEGFIYYRVNMKTVDKKLVVVKNRIDGPWNQYDSLVPTSRFFELLNDSDLHKFGLKTDYSQYTLTAQGSTISYGVKDTKKYFLQGNQAIEINNRELPVTGYMLTVCGGNGESGITDCEERSDYFYDAAYNRHDGEVSEQEILQFAEADGRVADWLKNHTGEQIGKEENGQYFLKQGLQWNEVSRDDYAKALKTTPLIKKVLEDGKWHVRYENKYGDAPHKMDVTIDAKTGDVLSVKAE